MRNEKVLYKNNIIRTKDYRQTFFYSIWFLFSPLTKRHKWCAFFMFCFIVFSQLTVLCFNCDHYCCFLCFILFIIRNVRKRRKFDEKYINGHFFWINCHFFKSTKLKTYKYAKEIVSVTVSQIDDRTNVIDTALINTSQTLIQVFFRSYNKKPHYYPHIKHWFSDR